MCLCPGIFHFTALSVLKFSVNFFYFFNFLEMCPRVRIEDKHTYNTSSSIIYTNQPNNAGVIYDNVIEYKTPNYPVTGTDESNRIGRKIQTSSIVSETYYSLIMDYPSADVGVPTTTFAEELTRVKSILTNHLAQTLGGANANLLTDFANAEVQRNLKFEPTLRHFIVEFEPDIIDMSTPGQPIRAQLASWYLQTFVYTTDLNLGQSNQQKVLRESTQWTGQFRILHDSLIKFTLNDPIKHEVTTLKYPRNLNFDGIGSDYPTNKNIIEFWIGPINTRLDYGSDGIGYLMDISFRPGAQFPLIKVEGTMKLNFSDM